MELFLVGLVAAAVGGVFIAALALASAPPDQPLDM
jgi:hypothetical protein